MLASEILLSRHQKNTLPHALLLTGSVGDFPQQFAKTILCLQQKESSCGHCHSCQLFNAKTHPDFMEPGSKIDDVREAIIEVQNTAQISRWKVLIIHAADNMNNAAANALLKTLEEPPAHVLIMLLTQQPSRLLPTIRSRCQRVCFPSQEYKNINNLEERRTLIHLFRNILTKKTLLFQPKDYPNILDDLSDWVMDLIRLKSGSNVVSEDVADILIDISSQASLPDLFTYLDRLYVARDYRAKQLNVNSALLFESLFA